jgi:hypothetical protein
MIRLVDAPRSVFLAFIFLAKGFDWACGSPGDFAAGNADGLPKCRRGFHLPDVLK